MKKTGLPVTFNKALSFSISLLLVFGVFLAIPTSVSAFQPTDFEVTAEAAILVSQDTGSVIFSKNIDQKMYPASLTKIMTCVIVLEETSDLDKEIITVSEEAVKSLEGTDSSTTGLKPGEELTARQMLYNLLMASANDGANAVAEHYGGGIVDNFVKKMNDKAAELHMTGTHYVNPHGLHDENHYTTVEDMYQLVSYALKQPAFLEIVSTVRYSMPPTNKSEKKTLATTNWLQDPSTAYYYAPVKGIKTGYTDAAGRCLITTASKDAYNYVCILMKCPVKDAGGNKVRWEFNETRKLYTWAFDKFGYKPVIGADEPVGEVKVDLAWDIDHLTLLPEKKFSAIIPKEADTSTISYKVALDAETVDAPIEKGAVLGTVTVFYAGEELGVVNLVASESVERNSILAAIRKAKELGSTLWFKLVLAAIALIIILFIILAMVGKRRRKKMKRVRSYRRL